MSLNTKDISYDIIKKTGLQNYLSIKDFEGILEKVYQEKNADVLTLKESKEIIRLLKSITTKNLTTYEIMENINRRLAFLKKNNRAIYEKILEYINDSFILIQKDYGPSFEHVRKNIFGIRSQKLNQEDYSFDDSYLKEAEYDSIKEERVGLLKNIFREKEENVKAIINVDYNYKKKEKLNKNLKNPSKANPNFSVFLMKNYICSPITRQNIETSAFFNLLNTQELSKAIPYMNVEFSLPTYISRQNRVIKSGTYTQFIFGKDKNNFEKTYKKNSPNTNINPEGRNITLSKTNMSIFTTPQTYTNLNESVGQEGTVKNNRITPVNDATRPFMSIESLNIDISPTKGLLNFKTGKLSLILHDKSRLADISAFIKPELFGEYGTDIDIEYGWSHLDQIDDKITGKIYNPIGAFIGSSKIKEKYSITNSSFTVQNDSSVKIELSLATKGAISFKEKSLNKNIKNRLTFNAVKVKIKEINELIDDYNISLEEYRIPEGGENKNIIMLNNENRSFEKFFIKGLDRIEENYFDKTVRLNQYQNIVIEEIYKYFNLISKIKFDLQNNRFYLNNSFVNLDNLILLNTFFSNLSISVENTESFSVELKEINRSGKEFLQKLSNIVNEITNYKNLLEELVDQDNLEDLYYNNFINNILGNKDIVDQFFDKDILAFLKKGTIKNERLLSINDSSNNYETKFITLGKVITNIVKNFISNNGDYDETQLIFYDSNERSGLMSGKSISSLIMNVEDLEDLLKKSYNGLNKNNELDSITNKNFTKPRLITIDSFLSQIINSFNNIISNPCFGTIHPKESTDDISFTERKNRLSLIYKILLDIEEETPNFKQCFPTIHFENLKSKKGKDILKIHVYDKNNNPFYSINKILNDYYVKDFKKAANIVRNSNLKNNYRSNIQLEKDILKDLVEKKSLKKLGKKYIPGDKFELNSIKESYKKYLPTAVFGSSNSVLLNANISSINEGKLSTLFIVNNERNEIGKENNKIDLKIPLRVLPAQATIETIGCPWINFNQGIFLEFGTGTTVDNLYTVTGISHSITKESFRTNVKLAYGDAYGSFEFNSEMINNVHKKNKSYKERINKNRNVKKTIKKRKKINKLERVINQTEKDFEFTNNMIKPGIRKPMLFDISKNMFTKKFILSEVESEDFSNNEIFNISLNKIMLSENHFRSNIIANDLKFSKFKKAIKNLKTNIGIFSLNIKDEISNTNISIIKNNNTVVENISLYKPKYNYLLNLREKDSIDFTTSNNENNIKLYNTSFFSNLNSKIKNNIYFEYLNVLSNINVAKVENDDITLEDIKKELIYIEVKKENNGKVINYSLNKDNSSELIVTQKNKFNIKSKYDESPKVSSLSEEIFLYKNLSFSHIINSDIVYAGFLNFKENFESLNDTFDNQIDQEKNKEIIKKLNDLNKRLVFLCKKDISFLSFKNHVTEDLYAFDKIEFKDGEYNVFYDDQNYMYQYIKEIFDDYEFLEESKINKIKQTEILELDGSPLPEEDYYFGYQNEKEYEFVYSLLKEELKEFKETFSEISDKDNNNKKEDNRFYKFNPINLTSQGNLTSTGSVIYKNQDAIRKSGIQPALFNKLKDYAEKFNLIVSIVSGGQPRNTVTVKGITYSRTGSKRHDDGYAADIRLYTKDNHVTSRKFFPLESICKINHKSNKEKGYLKTLKKYPQLSSNLRGDVKNIEARYRNILKKAFKDVSKKGLTYTDSETLPLLKFVHKALSEGLSIGIGSNYQNYAIHIDIAKDSPQYKKSPSAIWSYGASKKPVEPWLHYLYENKDKSFDSLKIEKYVEEE